MLCLRTNLAIDQSSRSYTHMHSLSSTPGGGGLKLSLFSLYKQRFPRYGPSLWVTGWFLKLPYFMYLGMKLGHWPKLRKLLIYSLSVPGGWNWAYFHSPGSCFRDIIFKIAIFGHKTWPLAKVPQVADIVSFYPKGSKLSLFSLYGQRFPRYGQIFKIAIFGHETWHLAKVPEVAHIMFCYPRGSKLKSFIDRHCDGHAETHMLINLRIMIIYHIVQWHIKTKICHFLLQSTSHTAPFCAGCGER